MAEESDGTNSYFKLIGIVKEVLDASIRITCINIRNGAKMELNNLSGTIYADTYRSQRETNFEEYLNTLYSSNDYTDMLEATVAGGLDSKIPLSTEDGAVYDPVFGWVVPGNVQQSTGDSDGDLNKQVGNMG